MAWELLRRFWQPASSTAPPKCNNPPSTARAHRTTTTVAKGSGGWKGVKLIFLAPSGPPKVCPAPIRKIQENSPQPTAASLPANATAKRHPLVGAGRAMVAPRQISDRNGTWSAPRSPSAVVLRMKREEARRYPARNTPATIGVIATHQQQRHQRPCSSRLPGASSLIDCF